MRILFLAQDLPIPEAPERGRFIANHLEVLRLDHDVTAVRLGTRMSLRLVTGPERRGGPHGSVLPWSVIGPPLARDLGAARSLRDLARTQQVIHTNALETARIGWALSRATGMPWIHSEHSSEWCVPTARGANALLTAIGRRAVGRATRTTAVSTFLADAMLAQTGAAPVVVPNIIDKPALGPAPERDPGQLHLLTSAAFVDYKEPLLAARAVARARPVLPPRLTWTWIGQGPLRDAFINEIARLGLSDAVQVLTPMEPRAYSEVMGAADLFFLPSRFETFCVAAAEALAVGVPVVLGPRGGHREFVDRTVGEIASKHSTSGYSGALASAAGRLGSFERSILRARVDQFSRPAVRAAFADAFNGLTSDTR